MARTRDLHGQQLDLCVLMLSYFGMRFKCVVAIRNLTHYLLQNSPYPTLWDAKDDIQTGSFHSWTTASGSCSIRKDHVIVTFLIIHKFFDFNSLSITMCIRTDTKIFNYLIWPQGCLTGRADTECWEKNKTSSFWGWNPTLLKSVCKNENGQTGLSWQEGYSNSHTHASQSW